VPLGCNFRGAGKIRSLTDLIALATHLVLVLVGASSLKSPRLRHFKSDRDEIWQECLSSK